MHGGNDTFVWNAGDGNDQVLGFSGIDTLEFNGNIANENFGIAANGALATVTRDINSVTIDMDETEIVRLNGADGTNTLTVGDMSGTELGEIVYTGGTGVDTINAGTTAVDIEATRWRQRRHFHYRGRQRSSSLGGAGDDTINAGAGNDILIGGAGLDFASGRRGGRHLPLHRRLRHGTR